MKKLDPLGDGISSLELVRTSGSDLDVVNAARVSFGTESGEFTQRDAKLIDYLLSHGHTSPFEHTHLVYSVKLPQYIAKQWMRHRIGVSYNELSQRYTKAALEFYTPKQWRVADTNNRQGSVATDIPDAQKQFDLYRNILEQCAQAYCVLLEAGISRELARGVLPYCTYTQFIFTCNLVSLFHFVRLRKDYHAQWEIQQYATGMLELVRPHFPVCVATWERLWQQNHQSADQNVKKEAPIQVNEKREQKQL